MTPLRIGLAGLGTVGGGVVKILADNAALIARRAGRPIVLGAVAARDRTRDRGLVLGDIAWADDACVLATHGDVDVVVEVMGGSEGVARALAAATLNAGRPFVTANKALVAHHGLDLAARAEARGTPFKFEAAVAGGIPVIKGIREGAAANAIARVYGILNGTCNYILSRMEADGADFADVLADAQGLGFAEADPAFDIEGTDAAHKLAILASLAFGTRLALGGVTTTGIGRVTAADIATARTLGYAIRLIGMARDEGGRLFQRVAPCLIAHGHPLAGVKGATNAVVAEGNFVGRLLFEGRGAGEGPTASAIVADLIDIARGEVGPAFAMPHAQLADANPADDGAMVERAYLRFGVEDRPGVLAEVAAVMRDTGVSIESLIQRGPSPGGGVLLAMMTHPGPSAAAAAAVAALASRASLTSAPLWLPVLDD